jgi:hypothetical protein
MKKKDEPASIVRCSRTLQFHIGKDSRGNWVVQDERGLCGGLFVNRAHALRFAMFENGSRPQAVIMEPGVFELNFNRPFAPAHHNANERRQRKVA